MKNVNDISNNTSKNIQESDLLLISNRINNSFIVNHNKYDKNEYKFYRKRIFELVKNIMNNKCNDKDIIQSFDYFIKDAIEFIKFQDKSDIIQTEYENALFLKDKNYLQDSNLPITPFGLSIIPEEINNIIFRDHDVKTIDIEKCLNLKKIQTNKQDNIIIPKQKEYNLKDPILKYKGIKNKS